MGLVALDVITALTIGLGGHYTDAPYGRLVYHRSGREPSIYLFSRSGYPYCAKSFGTADPVGDYEPAICTMEAVAALKRHDDGTKRAHRRPPRAAPPGLRRDGAVLLHHRRPPGRRRREARSVRGCWSRRGRRGTFGEVCALLAGEYGEFSAEAHLFAGKDAHYAGAATTRTKVYASPCTPTWPRRW